MNLPKKSGLEILTEVKSDPIQKTLPIVILTSSDAEEDILGSYENHANCYITKPVDLERFIKIVETIEDFCFTSVKLPKD